MTRTPDAWDVVSEPIHYIPAPRRSMSLRAFAVIAALAVIGGALWAVSYG